MRLIKSTTTAVLAAGVCTGVLVAFPLAAPVMGGVIPDGVATLWGSALGAAIAVGGSYWAAGIPARIQRKNAAALVSSTFSGLAFMLEELAYIYGERSTPSAHGNDMEPDVIDGERWRQLADGAAHFLDTHASTLKKVNRIDGVLQFLGPSGLRAVLDLEPELQQAVHVVRQLLEEATLTNRGKRPPHASWSTRFALGVQVTHIHELLSDLEVAA